MKKEYSLDYSIERDTDRLEAVRTILDEMKGKPSQKDLETMASYILYGKDENGLNSVQRGETHDNEEKRYKTYRKAEDFVVSLDEILEDPLADHGHFREVDARRPVKIRPRVPKRPKYDKATGELIDIGDADVPGMVELWEAIDKTEHTLYANEGLVPFNENDSVITDPYRLWQLKHQLIDMRRHTYYLLDAYKPTLHFTAVQPTSARTYTWEDDTFYWMDFEDWLERVSTTYNGYISKNLDDYETREVDGDIQVKWIVRRHHFDWENTAHIKALMQYYGDIYMQLWDKLDSWGRTLIYDFDRYVDMCDFTDVRMYILIRKIDRANAQTIRDEVQEQFGINYKIETIQTIMNKEIPSKIALAATKARLILETPMEEKKRCSRCKQWLPISPLFFIKNKSKKFGIESCCKECARKRRIELGRQEKYDHRTKDPKVLQV